ncbi:hypothetical protein Hanom_Chr10g00913081 [Helianthus anomalus]
MGSSTIKSIDPEPSLARRSYSPTHSNHRSSFLLLRPVTSAPIFLLRFNPFFLLTNII